MNTINTGINDGMTGILEYMLDQLQVSDLVIIFIIILLSMAFHEAMHAFTSHWLGDTTARDEGRLTLNPLKHIDIYTTVALPLVLILLHIPPFFIAKPVPFNPDRVRFEEFGAALIGIAGPLTNLVLALAVASVVQLTGVTTGSSIYNIASIIVVINLGFFVFNMIPFPPLDGSRLLYAVAPESVQKVMYMIESGGLMMIIMFMFVLFPVIIPVVNNVINHLYNFLMV